MIVFDLIDDETKKQLNVNPVKRKKEKLSRHDIEELMGTKRDTYKRVNGKVRRK